MKLTSIITLTATAIFSFANTVFADDIVDIAVGNGSFTTLVAAVSAAGLVDTLKSPGPFTVFAPTDAAFAALPAGTVEALLADPSGALTDILLYHVVSGKALSSDLSDRLPITTVLGQDVCVYIDEDDDDDDDDDEDEDDDDDDEDDDDEDDEDDDDDVEVYINDSEVIIADIEASNGVIHVIDAVLLPSDKRKSGKCPKSWSYKGAKGKGAKGKGAKGKGAKDDDRRLRG